MIQDPRFGQSDAKKIFENDLIKTEKASKALLCEISSKLSPEGGIPVTGTIIVVPEPSSLYNTNEQFIVSDTGTLTLAANTYHSVSYAVLSGIANITEVTLLSSAPQGYSAESVASGLLVNAITITGLSSGTKVVIKTLR